ncbi:hypothetical protein ACV36O_30250, partial [Pseudomonas aeruginosa]
LQVAALPLQRVQRRDLEFAARFEHDFEPICCLPVRPDERVDVQGLLWIQDGGTYGTSDNRNLSVFLRGMLLDDDARDLLPSWIHSRPCTSTRSSGRTGRQQIGSKSCSKRAANSRSRRC